MAENKKAKKSGNPAVRATAKVSSAADFKKNRGGIITLPSGLVVKANRAGGLRAFVASGNIPNSLMGIVDDALNPEKGHKAPDASSILGEDNEMDAQTLKDMLDLTDAVVCQVVQEPEILPAPFDEEARDENLLYVDEVEDEDKMFIFQWVTGGTTDVERFRKESAGAMDDLAGRADAGGKAK